MIGTETSSDDCWRTFTELVVAVIVVVKEGVDAVSCEPLISLGLVLPLLDFDVIDCVSHGRIQSAP